MSEGKIKIKDLSREDTIVCFIVRLALEHNETHSKISTRTHRKVGKNRRQTFCERSVSEVSSSEEYISSDESYYSSEESESENHQGLGKYSFLKETQMFHFLPVEKRKKASKLFQYLTTHKIFRLTRDGEIIMKGKKLNDSNIVELITHAVDNILSQPVGMRYFYRTLKKNNVPDRYILNKIGKQIMNKSLPNETSIWKPPGQLNKN